MYMCMHSLTEEMFRQGTAVGIPGQPPFGLAEIGALQGCPQHEQRIGMLSPATRHMIPERLEFQCTDVLREMQSSGMIGRMGCDCLRIVVHTSNHLGTRRTVNTGRIDTS